MGIFKPAWQSKNESKAMSALGAINDPAKLEEIAQHAPLAKVREVAASRKQRIKQEAFNVELGIPFLCPLCGTATQGTVHTCTNCNWDESICPYVDGFNAKSGLYEKCSLTPPNKTCIANPYGFAYEECAIYASHPYDHTTGTSKTTSSIHDEQVKIVNRYEQGLAFLDTCGIFDEAKFNEFNRIIGNQFSDYDIQKQLKNAGMMMRGMEDLKELLRSQIIQAIETFK